MKMNKIVLASALLLSVVSSASFGAMNSPILQLQSPGKIDHLETKSLMLNKGVKSGYYYTVRCEVIVEIPDPKSTGNPRIGISKSYAGGPAGGWYDKMNGHEMMLGNASLEVKSVNHYETAPIMPSGSDPSIEFFNSDDTAVISVNNCTAELWISPYSNNNQK